MTVYRFPAAALFALLFSVFCFAATPSLAFSLPGSGQEAGKTEEVPDSLGRDTPRGLMSGYLQAIRSKNYGTAGKYLSMPQSSESFRLARSTKLAEDLELLLDRAGALTDNWAMSPQPKGNVGDGEAENIDVLGQIKIAGKEVPLLAERTKLEDGRMIWLIAPATVDQIPALLAKSKLSLIDRLMPEATRDLDVLNVPLSHILFSFGATAVLWLAVRLLVALLHLGLGRVTLNTAAAPYVETAAAMKGPAGITLAAIFTLPLLELSGASVVLRGHISPMLDIITSIGLAAMAMKVIDHLGRASMRRAQDMGYVGSVSFLALARRGAKLVIWFVLALLVLDAVGVDLTAGLAALGIGGIAIALGSQKTIEHFVGSVTVVADRVVRIGDFCRFGTIYGTVEDIGIRSTRIRTLTRTLVTVPNGVFSSGEVENYTTRDKYHFKHILALAPGTTRDALTTCLGNLREMLETDPAVDPDPRRVRLVAIDGGTSKIELNAYVFAEDWNAFLEKQETMLMKVLEIIESSGTSIALPAQVFYSPAQAGAPEFEAPKALSLSRFFTAG